MDIGARDVRVKPHVPELQAVERVAAYGRTTGQRNNKPITGQRRTEKCHYYNPDANIQGFHLAATRQNQHELYVFISRPTRR